MDADGTGLCGEHEALHTDDVADVEFLEDGVVHRFIFAGANLVAFDVDLDSADGILEFVEGDGAHDALAHDTTGEAHILEKGVVGRIFFKDFFRIGIHLEERSGVCVDA